MKSTNTVMLTVILATLLALSQTLSLTHEQSPYTTWDYIKGRVQELNHCFHVLPPDDNTVFTWKDPNILSISGNCGTAECTFTLQDKTFTFGACTPATLNPPCADYIDRIRRSTHVSLVSNLIKFFPTNNINVVPNLVLADKKK